MSIYGINGPSGAARSAASAPPPTDTAATAGSARAAAETSADAVPAETSSSRPASLRFPWLSRLSAELEAASNQRARFPTQIIGDNLDQKA